MKKAKKNPHPEGTVEYFRWWGSQGGATKSDAKATASRRNGLRGGRPRGKP